MIENTNKLFHIIYLTRHKFLKIPIMYSYDKKNTNNYKIDATAQLTHSKTG